MSKKKDVIYDIRMEVLSSWTYDKDKNIVFVPIKDIYDEDTIVSCYTGFNSKKKAKKTFKALCHLMSYSKVEISISKDTLIDNDTWVTTKIGKVRVLNEENYNKKKIKKIIDKFDW